MPRIAAFVCVVATTLLVVWPASGQPKGAPTILAEGPESIKIRRPKLGGGIQEETGILCFVLPDKVIFRASAKGLPRVFFAEQVISVETEDGKYRWEVDKTRKVFIGKVKPPETIDLTPLASAGRDESAFLFQLIESLHVDVDRAMAGTEGLAELQKVADRYSRLATEKKLDPALADLSRGVSALVDQYNNLRANLRQLEAEIQYKKDQLFREFSRARTRNAVAGLEELLDSDGSTISVAAVFAKAGVIDSYYTQEIAGQLKDLEDAQLKKVSALFNSFDKVRSEQWQKLYRVGNQRFGQPDIEARGQQKKLLDKLSAARDLDGLSKYFRQLAERDPNNPFRKADYCQIASLVPSTDRAKKVAELRTLSRECLQAVRLVPAGADYDRARLTLLSQACLLACAAADRELEGEAWGTAYSPLAAHAVRLLDRFFEFDQFFELTGQLREKRAWALFQAGRTDEALEQALRIEELRKSAPSFGYGLARVYAHKGETKLAMKWLEQAIRDAGLSDIMDVRTNPDLASVRVKEKQAFETLTAVNFAVTPAGNFAFQPSDVKLTNKSAFTWTAVTINLVLPLPKGQSKTVPYPTRFRAIKPGETVFLKDFLSGVDPRLVRVTIDCDQNRKR
jgi:tetratricopeptide (TPR) repeat protein